MRNIFVSAYSSIRFYNVILRNKINRKYHEHTENHRRREVLLYCVKLVKFVILEILKVYRDL